MPSSSIKHNKPQNKTKTKTKTNPKRQNKNKTKTKPNPKRQTKTKTNPKLQNKNKNKNKTKRKYYLKKGGFGPRQPDKSAMMVANARNIGTLFSQKNMKIMRKRMNARLDRITQTPTRIPINKITNIIDQANIKCDETPCAVLGEGNFGTVYKGTYKNNNNNTGLPVAIKVLTKTDDDSKADFLIEKHIGSMFGHVNVIKLYGESELTIDGNLNPCLVIEFCSNGDLLSYLQKHKPEVPENDNILFKLNLMKQICKGMEHIHNKGVFHRDLGARNILLDADSNAKVADFGMSKEVGKIKEIVLKGGSGNEVPVQNPNPYEVPVPVPVPVQNPYEVPVPQNQNPYEVPVPTEVITLYNPIHNNNPANNAFYSPSGNKPMLLPIRWCSPEVLTKQKFSKKSDVWAFGITAYEIFTDGEVPYKNLSNQEAGQSIVAGTLLTNPPNCPTIVFDKIISTCWKSDNESYNNDFTNILTRIEEIEIENKNKNLSTIPEDGEVTTSSNVKNNNQPREFYNYPAPKTGLNTPADNTTVDTKYPATYELVLY